MKKNLLFLPFILILCSFNILQASHNIAGEITYRQIGDPSNYEYEITLVTYTLSTSSAAHRPNAEIFFGHGDPESSSTVRASEEKVDVPPIGSKIWRNKYVVTHKFPGPGCYTINYSDPNRIEDILNINEGQSQDIPFYVESDLCINTVLGAPYNNSPLLLERPISYACLGVQYKHNPNAYDPDGDSLVYSLIPPKYEKGIDVPRYVNPNIVGNQGGTISIDSYTGELIWNRPLREGKYNIAIYIEEYRRVQTSSGTLLRRIGSVTRDMQIIVEKCNNDPPVIAELNDTCVEAGSNFILRIPVTATDPNNEIVSLTASGGPFILDDSPANSFGNIEYLEPVSGNFIWRIDCSHIRKEPYRVVFNATDKGNGKLGQELSDIKHIDIKVVGPKPKNLLGEGIGNGIKLTWEKPNCDNIAAYFIYRKVAPSNWDPSYCDVGVPASTGFKRIAIVDDPKQLEYYDNNNEKGLYHGISYCYRVTALYLNEGQFEAVEGYASNETCAELKIDVPIIYEATVNTTDKINGETKLSWIKPTELDTNQYKGPYRYSIQEANDLNGSNFNEILSINANSFYALNQQLNYLSSQLNTMDEPHSYKIDFYFTNELSGDEELIGTAKSASTPYLEIKPGFKQLELIVNTDVPWQNIQYVYYQLDKQNNNWNIMDTSTSNSYTVSNLINGVQYCFKAQTIGSFFVDSMPDPIINFSQSACSIPIDTIPPCAPTLAANADCSNYKNYLEWSFTDLDCAFDVIGYNIYFSDLGVGDFEKIATIDGDKFTNSFIDERDTLLYSLAGCYHVTAIDSYYNESQPSNSVCVDNCPEYKLPNVFTPNGDEFNDLFGPYPYKFVKEVDMYIYNRWGQIVYQTNDPDINWNGRDQKNNKMLSPGVYFYVCNVTMLRLYRPELKKLKGVIHIIK